MKYTTHNNGNIKFQSSWLQGYVDVSYARLVEVFGNPMNGDGYKVDAEWTILFEDGTYAIVYNYKDGHNYNGEDGTPTELITDWHIGGNDERVVSLVNDVVAAPFPAAEDAAPLVFANGQVDEMTYAGSGMGDEEELEF